MSGILPSLTPKEAAAALERMGFVIFRQRGSHRVYVKKDLQIIVPFHSKDLKKGTLHQIIKGANATVDEFLKYL